MEFSSWEINRTKLVRFQQPHLITEGYIVCCQIIRIASNHSCSPWLEIRYTPLWKINMFNRPNILQWLMVSSCKDLIGTLWGLPKPHGNPTQTLHKPFVFPSVCLGLAWVFDGSWWYLLLAGHSLCGSRPSIGLVSGAIITNQKRNWCS